MDAVARKIWDVETVEAEVVKHCRSMSGAGVWADDSQVVRTVAEKHYGEVDRTIVRVKAASS
ncbi:hypothetical protein AU467_22640 [Mesorhizobium loti]|uniref:Uncharacterized protein n=1 Tax=Rhizobium loti TaxID=381 RepID=A0A101KSR7_RHILI|nr:hypothetical protein AU467_22640 [Mesorhizobium loti]